MSDLLRQSALAYKELMPYRYIFTLGLRNKSYTVRLGFPENAFYHLSGLHKMGIAALKRDKAPLQKILEGKVTQEMVRKAGVDIEDRWIGICRLKNMLENNQIVFQYRSNHHRGSIIKAEYLIYDEETLFFIHGESPASIFGQKHQGYEAGCPRMTVLRIQKEKTETGEIEEIYRYKNYRLPEAKMENDNKQ